MKKVKISELTLWDKNPRIIKDKRFQALCQSLTDDPSFMELRPILATKEGRIYAGNMRYRAAKELGWTEVPAIITDIPEKLANERAIKDNNKFGEWNNDELATILDEMEKAGTDISTFGLDDQIQKIIEQLNEKEIVEDEVPEVPKEAKTKLGDLYILGSHRLLCGDSTSVDAVEKLVEGKKVDMVFTDPPYALFGNSTGVAGIADDKMIRPFFRDIFVNCRMYTKQYGHIYVCCDWHSAFVLESVARDVELSKKNMCIWYKGGGGVGGMYSNTYEIVWFFANSPVAKTTMGDGKSGERTVNGIDNVWQVKREKDGEHNAQKPVKMIQIPIKAGTDIKQSVLDLFGGSGSTLIACEQLNRKCYMMELDPKYCDVIIARWEKLTGQKAKLA